MASVYDFQSLERELASIDKKFSSFEATFDKTISTISSAKFNQKEYGQQALEKKSSSILSEAKKKINSAYNEYINGVRRASHDSLETIKKAANAAAKYVDNLNSFLASLERVNTAFSNQEYRDIINMEYDCSSLDPEVTEYLLYLKLESYDNICRNEVHDVSFDTYADFENYYYLCKKYEACKHLSNACKLLLEASYSLIHSQALTGSDLYGVCIKGLKAYSLLTGDEKKQYASVYAELYDKAIAEFNSLADNAFDKFAYSDVKMYLDDSILFKGEDIHNSFFADRSNPSRKLFDYAKEHSCGASFEIMKDVFEDTKILANDTTLQEYYGFWISRYDDWGADFINKVSSLQKDRFVTVSVLCESLSENSQHIQHFGSCFLNLVNDYQNHLMSIKDSIPFYTFLQSTIAWNNQVKRTNKCSNKEENDKLLDAITILDGIAYSMIVKYQKICSYYNQKFIDDLNRVLDDSSNRVLGKPYRKDIKKAPKEDDSCLSANVKLTTVEMTKKKNKKVIFGLSLAVALIAILVILYFIFLKK